MTDLTIDAPPTRIAFEVVGHPEPAGSKKAFAVRRKQGGGWVNTGQVAVTDDNPKSKGWQSRVQDAALDAMIDGDGPIGALEGALGLAVIFTVLRPKGHFGTGRNAGTLKPSAPDYPTVKPDATKLLRGLEDALTGLLWRDDAQVVEQAVLKRYGAREGAKVTVWEL